MRRWRFAWSAARIVLAWGLLSSVQAAEPPLQAAANRIMGGDQAFLLVAEDGEILAAQHESRPVHPASVSKVAATLALLRKFGPEHRFRTRLESAAPVVDGRLEGDLRIVGAGDPFLVSESAVHLALGLRRSGVETIDGRLRADDHLLFNWRADSREALRQALEGEGCSEVAGALRRWSPAMVGLECDAVAVEILEGDFPSDTVGPGRTLAAWESPPLRRILKELNAFSNNVFEPFVREQIPGGATPVVRAALPGTPAREIRIDNAAGLGKTNRLSPRATVALVATLEEELLARGLALRDVLPVAGEDAGTLEDRLAEPPLRRALVAKTGTLPSQQVSAFAGVARTARWGRVRFAILNRGLPVLKARERQDRLLRHLFASAGPLPLPGESEPLPAWAEGRLQ